MVHNFFDQYTQLIGIKRFEHVVIGAVSHGFDGRWNRAVSGDHDNIGFRVTFFDAAQNVQTADALHFDIHQKNVKLGFFDFL